MLKTIYHQFLGTPFMAEQVAAIIDVDHYWVKNDKITEYVSFFRRLEILHYHLFVYFLLFLYNGHAFLDAVED